MTPNLLSNPIFQEYFSASPAPDELLGEDGDLRPDWKTFFQAYTQLGDQEVLSRNNDILRLLRENGVTYNIYGDPGGLNRPWMLDIIPFLISREEWEHMEAGLKQRAELFNLILEDIYGSQRLIKEKILPVDLVYRHTGFLRNCVGIKQAGNRSLVLYSADLARGTDGRIWVVNDRTQAPSGSGYALENRTTMTRVVPELFSGLQVRHLSPYFNALRSALHDMAPSANLNPRTVILTPGSTNETYFEHAYLASYLGFTLVHGNDLIVKDNYVWLKTMGGLEKIDLILRRVDDIYCDPLELKEDSRLGVPGLLQVVRSGNVSLANPLGSGILENPGLMPFLHEIARYFLGEDLRIPTIASWWCGQPGEQQYVLDHLEHLVVKQIHRNPTGSSSIDGGSLSGAERQALVARIRANPGLYVGQEKVNIAASPSLVDNRLARRKVLFRSFLVANPDGYTAMTGGLCRSSSEAGNFLISNQLGGLSKDAWIISPEPERVLSPLREQEGRDALAYHDMLSSHAAENLFWVGRYLERVLGNARFLRTVMQFLAEGNKLATEHNAQTERQLLTAYTGFSYTFPGFTGKAAEARFTEPWKELRDVFFNEKRSGSLKYNFQQFNRAVHEVRDHWSTDTWRVLRTIEEELQQEPGQTHPGHLDMLHTLDNLITAIVAFTGLNRESISREQGWIMLELGRKIEQSLLLITMLRETMVKRFDEQVEYNLQQSVLMSNESLVNYRYQYRSPIQAALVLDLLLFDPNNPRSLRYQVNRLRAYIQDLPQKQGIRPAQESEKLIGEAEDLLRKTDQQDLLREDAESGSYSRLDDFLERANGLIAAIPLNLSRNYFKHEEAPKQIMVG